MHDETRFPGASCIYDWLGYVLAIPCLTKDALFIWSHAADCPGLAWPYYFGHVMCLFRHTLAEIVIGMPSYYVHCHHANLSRRSRLARIHHLLRQRSFPTKGPAADPNILPSETLAIPNDMLIQLNDNIRNIFYSKSLGRRDSHADDVAISYRPIPWM